MYKMLRELYKTWNFMIKKNNNSKKELLLPLSKLILQFKKILLFMHSKIKIKNITGIPMDLMLVW